MFIQFDPKAQLELEEAIAYYDSINRQLADRFLNSFELSLNRITQFPNAWTPLLQNVRRCHIDGFPYAIVYKFENDLILILAIMHLQRKPNYWIDKN
jgi:toxin ParE2